MLINVAKLHHTKHVCQQLEETTYKELSRKCQENLTTTDIFTRHDKREAADPCNKFTLGDPAKQEFYSPVYPAPYRSRLDCHRVLEGQ